MDEENIQTKTVSVSKTKMAVAIGLLGLSALAAGFAGLRYGRFMPDLAFFESLTNGNDLTQLNQFSITLQNAGRADVTSPFVLHIKLGDDTNVVRSIKVLNPVSDRIRGSYEMLESDTGNFDVFVKNFNLSPGQKNTITFWFVIPSDYNSDKLPVEYTVDTTNVVSEADETNKRYKQMLDIAQSGLIKEPSVTPTVIVFESDYSGTSHVPQVQDTLGVFSFLSTSTNHILALNSMTLTLSGDLITDAKSDNRVNVSLYNGTPFDSNHFMASGVINGVHMGTSTPSLINVDTQNEWSSGMKTVYVVVDTTDSDFYDSPTQRNYLMSMLEGFTWTDITTGQEYSGSTGLPVHSDVYIYEY